jgi:hypothetical protein
MNVRRITAAVASIFVGLAAQSLAQSNADRASGAASQPDQRDSFTHGESKRCASLSGAAKEQCDKEEATKTQGPAAQEAQSAPADRSSSGSSAAGGTFTHGESKRCEGMTGADKDQCDKEEATKTQGDAARDASK